MKMKRKSNILINTLFWSIIASIMGYIISFFVTPYVTEKMGVEAYGFVTLTKTFVDYGALITTAMNSYAVRYIGVEYHKGNFEKANKYYNSVLIADVFLATIIVIVSVLFSFTVKTTLKVPAYLVSDVQHLFILSFLNFAINTIMAVFSASAYLKNKLDLFYIFRTIGYSAEALMLVILFSGFDTHLYYIGVSYVVEAIIILISRIWMTKKWTPELKYKFSDFRISVIRKLVINGIWNSINSLGNILNTGLDLLITNIMLSATDMGLLSVVKTFPTMFVMLYQLIFQPFQPALLQSYSVGNKQELKQTLQKAMKASGYVTFLVFAGFVAVGKSFYRLWLPSQNSDILYVLTILALLPNAMEGILYPCYYIYTLCIKNKVPCIITIISGIFNVGGMYLLIKGTSLGIYAVLITTVVVMGIVTYITNPLYMTKCLNEKPSFIYRVVIKGIVCCLLMCVLMKLIASLFVINSWIHLIMVVVVIATIGTVVYFFSMLSKEEKNIIIDKLRRI